MRFQISLADDEVKDLKDFLTNCLEYYDFERAHQNIGYKMRGQVEQWIKDLQNVK